MSRRRRRKKSSGGSGVMLVLFVALFLGLLFFAGDFADATGGPTPTISPFTALLGVGAIAGGYMVADKIIASKGNGVAVLVALIGLALIIWLLPVMYGGG